MKKVSIVIVNWNGIIQTRQCLRSLGKLVKKDIELTTIVVDNGSTDGSIGTIRKEFSDVVALPQESNRGFTGGNNAGIDYALEHGANYVWLLNNDTEVDKQSLTALIHAEADIVGSKIYFAPGFEYHKDRYKESERGRVIWYAGGIIDWQNMYASHRGVDEVDHGQYDVRVETDFVTGCSMMVRSEVFKRIGLFDERYYLYLEDVDLSLRAQKGGFRLIYEPVSVVWHKNAGSSGGVGSHLHDYYLMRNRFLLGFGYAPLRTRVALLRQVISLLFGQNREHRRAAVDALIGQWGKQYEPTRNHN
ncbi:hypothetical protein A2875_02065 [Candidatus Gottesmanbacteria bacterium RIFCSPHIGHO2_01_FULL_46_14]|uniref:Glycosyltransferase 2-like domain-containing protein n=3 Tax=Microgenomates group TaxID=1794810 RepID=A0A1F5ZQ39_9BACT|nr:MAG: Glycosyl transferase family 2 [Candidatus Curtissbacteria bacterium GW2011_GWA1_41_11]OGG14558.1 MAG: hypothetical protein A2875_02065 [Candidatus Gottesmanbacteria bacterium RIFCSPHIGHO2_01_FULL_46_14]OGG29927.1 MAG: hypothetical protein A2971_04205 [Candidatus Gottesmanbacteria bacterium RIFCSPLOWO2_01_FULL_46_21]